MIRSGSSLHVTRRKRSSTRFHRLIRPSTEASSQSGVSRANRTRSSSILCHRIRFLACRVIRTGFTARLYRDLPPVGTSAREEPFKELLELMERREHHVVPFPRGGCSFCHDRWWEQQEPLRECERAFPQLTILHVKERPHQVKGVQGLTELQFPVRWFRVNPLVPTDWAIA